MADAQLPAKPKRIPGLPNNHQLLTFDGFDGLNTKPTRAGLKDQQCFVLDNFMPLGKSNVRTLYDVGGAIAHIDATGQIQPGPTPSPSPTPTFGALGVNFDGLTLVTNNSLVATDSSVLSLSLWFRLSNVLLSCTGWAIDPTNTDASFDFESSNPPNDVGYDIRLQDLALTTRLEVDAVNPLTAGSWHHVLFSCDVNHGAGSKIVKLYIDGADATQLVSDAGAAFIVSANGLPFFVGGDTFENLVGDWGEFWWGLDQSLLVAGDIPAATVAKFILAGAPVDLGPTGSTPTGIAPAIYLSRRTGDPAAAFATNRGTGGAFSVSSGTLTASATDPHL